MIDVIGTQHPLHPLIKAPIGEAEETKRVNLYQSEPQRLVIHCPRCPLTVIFLDIIATAIVFDSNKRATVWDLLQHGGLPKDRIYISREMVSPFLFNRIMGENDILKRKQMSMNFEIENLK